MLRHSLAQTLVAVALLTSCGPTVPPEEGTHDGTHAAVEPIPIKVVIVTMFEKGDDTGDTPGEFQYWAERMPLEETVAFPMGYRDLRLNRELGVLGIVTGIGTAKAAASIMALGLDDRFDLTKAYWLVAGIAGVDPEDASVVSAAWAEWLIDGDISHEIDPREAPEGWTTGYIPLRKSEPFELPVPENNEGAVYRLEPGLVDWAYQLTADIELPQTEETRELSALYDGYPNAQAAPKVMKGDQLAAMTYWHGELLNDWANDWVSYWTHGAGNYVTSAMEDTGTRQSLLFLAEAGRVDADRFLVLRTASNYTMQFAGATAYESLSREKLSGKGYSAYVPSLESAWLVGSVVVHELLEGWDRYEETLPSP